jgi:hypothetical protein
MKAILREAARAPQCIQLNNHACSAPASNPSSAIVSSRFSFPPGTARTSCPGAQEQPYRGLHLPALSRAPR